MVRVVCEIYLGQVVDSAFMPFALLLSQSVEEGRISLSHVRQGWLQKKNDTKQSTLGVIHKPWGADYLSFLGCAGPAID